jgi:hypothetical protein
MFNGWSIYPVVPRNGPQFFFHPGAYIVMSMKIDIGLTKLPQEIWPSVSKFIWNFIQFVNSVVKISHHGSLRSTFYVNGIVQ